ncbi:BolA-like protein 3 [Hanseniaspora valbyensis]
MFRYTRVLLNNISQTPYESKITKLLTTSELNPSVCKVQDVSGGCGSMFNIQIKSKQFNKINKIKQHKLVNKVLKDEISKWHGLVLTTEKDL